MKTLQEDLKTGNFKHCYLLYGEEPYLVQQYKTRLKNALSVEGDTMNTSVFSGKDIRPEALIDLAETLPFFAERRVILVDTSSLVISSCNARRIRLSACSFIVISFMAVLYPLYFISYCGMIF
jgi:DNA polymerase III delta subunit